MTSTTMQKIHKRCERRQRLWAAGLPDPHVIATLTMEIHELYAERRLELARERSGPAWLIAKRARVEQELEKLMT